MFWWDVGNAAFEIVGAVMVWLNVIAIRRDQLIAGIDWRVNIFWSTWGLWNLGFYGPALGLWYSWGAGVVLVAGNITWVILALKLKRAQKNATA